MLATAFSLADYEFIVIGPGAGGSPLAGHKTLLLESGDDQGDNTNYNFWNFYVRHYSDDNRQARDYKTVYSTPTGETYVGLRPPPGSTMKGILYPRGGTFDGSAAHNALTSIYSYCGWLSTQTSSSEVVLDDPQLLGLFLGGVGALGKPANLLTLLAGDINTELPKRDTEPAAYQIPVQTDDGRRRSPRERVLTVRAAGHPLAIRTNCHVTKVLFDRSVFPPRATGVSFLEGKHLYSASPLARQDNFFLGGIPGTAIPSREVIIAGGVSNSPQLLHLSGIGPAENLRQWGIEPLVNLPGVGTNLQDHYEIVVISRFPNKSSFLHGCTFSYPEGPDPCYQRWQIPIHGHRATYATAGFPVGLLYKSTVTTNNTCDVLLFGGPTGYRGFWPGFSVNITSDHRIFVWAVLEAHPRNRAGTVSLKSTDSLETPDIEFNYYDTGSPGYEEDLQAQVEGILLARNALEKQPTPFKEILPGPEVATREYIIRYAQDTAWGHHGCCTCPIGADDDPMAVLDSKFRVRGVTGLRVVEGSAFSWLPSSFPVLATYMIAEKAAAEILSETKEEL
ncbi:GMC family oxidoreductase [Aspergillus homomorphus CBS 101889]|uniref:GMC oxidoreductase n=1 Tax=Aspergillus homomorphus (strain CBS 101889) TaxID=1450537 RepID=A0A395I5C6_ASPHC|nr:GMC oxidoreductase [Aspergillus homomorphus CBS 101889]RAL14743.1 GMC oxidoreductase [Aspergillus homomorphus CBS 101889]